MHWGLTEFERKRIERIALDHPYFDMHAPLLTKKEIHAILAQGPRKTGPQVIAEVKEELGINDVSLKHQKRTLIDALRDASFVPSFRRTVVLGALCLLLVLFMTLTVPGKAFAEEIYSLVINLVDNVFGVSNMTPTPNDSKLDMSSIPDGIETPRKFYIETGYPLLVTDDSLLSFNYDVLENKRLTVRSRYKVSAEKKYTITQFVYNPDVLWSSSYDTSGSVYATTTAFGLDLYIMTTHDGSTVINGYSEAYMVSIMSRTMSVSELLTCVENVHPCN